MGRSLLLRMLPLKWGGVWERDYTDWATMEGCVALGVCLLLYSLSPPPLPPFSLSLPLPLLLSLSLPSPSLPLPPSLYI